MYIYAYIYIYIYIYTFIYINLYIYTRRILFYDKAGSKITTFYTELKIAN